MAAADRARVGLAALAALGLVTWEQAFATIAALTGWAPSELVLYATDKLGFALLLAVLLTTTRTWRRAGFAGGAKLGFLPLLWPIWLDAAISALQGVADTEPAHLAGWLAVSAAVGFGEEALFRGSIISLLGRSRPLRAVIVSSALFAAVHLAGLLSAIDWRLILAQVWGVFGLGLILGAVRIRARSIWPGILTHTALDFLGIAAGGSVTEAMQYSPETIGYMLGAGLIAAGWGAFLCRRLPVNGHAPA